VFESHNAPIGKVVRCSYIIAPTIGKVVRSSYVITLL
jgi:hypothetical protein